MASYKGPASESQRVMHLQKKRERHQEDMEIKKKKLADDLKFDKMESKFSAHYDAVETNLKTATVGLLTMEQMKNRQEEAVRAREKLLARKSKDELKTLRKEERAKEEERKKQKAKIEKLSFNPDDDEEEEEEDSEVVDDQKVNTEALKEEDIKEEAAEEEDDEEEEEELSIRPGSSKAAMKKEPPQMKRKRFGKNPNVDTSFLPDVERDEEENNLREQLRQQWEERQKQLKEESIHITFSYWDGSGHRRSLTMKKGMTIYQFLQKALEVLRTDFPELKTVTADQLMYVKEDLIIPQTNTFYDFIVTKARGKSGPLFSFDVHDDIRMVSDATVEKDESHAGKVVLRNWYERNKHIFPASRWEPFDPTKKYEKYTVADTPKNKQ